MTGWKPSCFVVHLKLHLSNKDQIIFHYILICKNLELTEGVLSFFPAMTVV